MKNIIIIFILVVASGALFQSCLEETFPTSSVPASQIGNSPEALEAVSNATAAYMFKLRPFDYSSAKYQEFSYPAMMLMKDMMTEDMANTNARDEYTFDHPWGGLTNRLSSGNYIIAPWRWYYQLIFNAHNTIWSVEDPENAAATIQRYYGNALLYRAVAYFDLGRMYEYRPTGYPQLDNEASENDIIGACTVIVDEHMTLDDLFDNPRAPFYKMFRFVLTDLNHAEKYLEGYTRRSKSEADVSVVNAMQARLWLEMATRFQLNPEELAVALAHENDEELLIYDKFGISSANDCYAKAAEYARKVINNSSYRPLDESQWYDIERGFNTSSFESWVFAVVINSMEAITQREYNWTSHMAIEFKRGLNNGATTKMHKMIGKSLYDRIGDSDWRKPTWIAPEDAGEAPDRNKYRTQMTDEEFREIPAYASFKFRPNGGETEEYKIACQTDIPVIRVEEMYFIEAEALTYTQGLSAGINALKQFLNTYRYTDGSYDCDPESVDDFIDNFLLVEKRIEQWGEGLTFYDHKRRKHAVIRGYPETNFLASHRFNSRPGYVAPWMNMYFPRSNEVSRNPALIQNPDPDVANVVGLWRE